MRVSQSVTVGILIAVAGCGTDGTGPQSDFDGVRYSAMVSTIQSGQSLTQFTVLVTLENLTTATVTRTYPAGCPVRVRLYRAADGVRVYDEMMLTCSVTTPATITLTSRESKTLTSGPRTPASVLGDSLQGGNYTVHGVAQTEGATFVELGAGSYLITIGS